MKKILAILSLILVISCHKNKEESHKHEFPFYVGTYTDGTSQGIYKYNLQNDGTLKLVGLAAKSTNPSYLIKSADKKYLLAVNEVDNVEGMGTVESYTISGDSLQFISRSRSGGAHPCFISIDKRGIVLTANYTSGTVGLHRLVKNGQLSDLLDVEQHTGHGITERQKGPHAHMVSLMPHSNNIISVDLGTNELWFSKLDTVQYKLIPSLNNKLAMDKGAGPRHFAFHPNTKWLYVINELKNTITLVKKDASGEYTKAQSFSNLPNNFNKPNTSAEIQISSDGNFIYTSNRGHNSIMIFKVNNVDGSLQNIGYQSTRGEGPRLFTLSPDENYLLVANQYTNNIVSFKRDKVTGLLKYAHQIEAPTPVCVLF